MSGVHAAIHTLINTKNKRDYYTTSKRKLKLLACGCKPFPKNRRAWCDHHMFVTLMVGFYIGFFLGLILASIGGGK